MAATAWDFYHEAKHKLCIGDAGGFNLSADFFKIELYKSAATTEADDLTLSIVSQISNECSGGNYTAGGKTLSLTTWAVSATSVQVFDGADWIITASDTAITSVKHAIIRNSVGATSGFLLCFSQLSTSAFDIAADNTLTIQMNTAGIFTLA